ncbi:nuclear transport factor 2 family protein [Pseudonocardia asaccharolytica]|uniref:SnoaL-like domain-containing protein n=1 Tax=Pseudonocardia asaccharolytica DSM 44247 = NBRC 16224 TaxID=1123024 RepID=A0A511D1A1_9PSEU|nr:nuclear transport factor 2 family protein [Pseudonocardia asaccharolytica]GEL18467.1 hypothetical protein PA7_23040 [Pseudonocardia asaccharolytica DSM 44247 = NBRC 16224]
MAEHPNEALVRRGYAAFSSGDMVGLAEVMAPDVVHHVPGNNPLAGGHTGRDAVFALYGRLAELSGGTLRVELREAVAKGENQVVTTHRATASRGDRKLDVIEHITFTIRDGQAVDLDETVEDQAAADAFWS